MGIQLHNTLTRTVETLTTVEPGAVRLYTCGPTVYNFAHIGNLRTYIFEDVLRRTLEHAGLRVNHVMNITDVGHLESDADTGEDKMTKAAEREQLSPWEVARFYEDKFFEDCERLNILAPSVKCRATEHVREIIEFVQGLERQGVTYAVDGNVYFDIIKYPGYEDLARLRLDQLLEGARVDPDPRKRNPADFVLWFSQSKFPNQVMKWPSPWGTGFPGWHIECSAMASKYLGDRIDIHCGGIDHIPVHHTNERAQSEALFGHRWVNIWMHGEFLVLDEGKMSKSAGEFLTLASLVDRGFDPAHYRYLCLGSRYQHPLRFSWEALQTARSSFENLRNRVISWKLKPGGGRDNLAPAYSSRFWAALEADLNMPAALAVVWEVAKDSALGNSAKFNLLIDFDDALGLGVGDFQRPPISSEMRQLIEERDAARRRRDWTVADQLRYKLLAAGIQVMDTQDGTEWYLAFEEERAKGVAGSEGA